MMEVNGTSRGWRGRLWGWAGENLARHGGLVEAAAVPPLFAVVEVVPRPAAEYQVRRAYRDNKLLFQKLHYWNLVKQPYPAYFNPVPRVVAFYLSHVLAGNLTVTPVERPAAETTNAARDVALVAAVGRVQERSNWLTFRRELVEGAAVEGDVFIKAVERLDAAGVTQGVYLQLLPVESVRRCVVDERGYVEGLRIDTPRMESAFGGRTREHTHVEIWDDVGVRFYEVEGHRRVDDDELPPAVGAQTFAELGYDFVPVVWARCATYWWDVVDQINEVNRLAWLLGRLNKPLMIVSANAEDSRGFPLPGPQLEKKSERPTYQELGDGAAAVMSLPGNATAAWSGAPVDFAAMQRQITDVQEFIEGSLPEYFVAARLQAVQVAAETLQMLLDQAGQRVLEMREVLEGALVRAQMMALTLGQVAGLDGFSAAEIGTYDEGDFGHAFAPRPVFAKSSASKVTEAGGHIDNGVEVQAAYELAGYSQAEAEMAARISAVAGLEQ